MDLLERHLHKRKVDIKFFQKIKLAKAAYELNSVKHQVDFKLTELFTDSEINYLMEEALKHGNTGGEGIKELIDQLFQEYRNKLFSYPCHKKWSDLLDVGREDEKFCLDCSKAVFKVSTEQEMKTRAHLGHCVSLNSKGFLDSKGTKFYACYLAEINEEQLFREEGLPF